VLGRFRLGAELNTLFDSNILRIGDGFAVNPDSDKADFRFSPAVTLATALPIGRQSVVLGGTLGRDIYARNTRLNRNRYSLDGGFNWRLGTRCSGLVDVAFSSRQVLFSEIAATAPNRQETLGYGASANCQAPVGLGFGGAVRQTEIRNSDPVRASFDVDSLTISPQISYGLASLGRFSIGGTWNKSNYPNRFLPTPAGRIERDEIEIASGRIGYQRGLGSRLSVTAGLSYLEVKSQPRVVLVEPLQPPPPAPLLPLVPVVRDNRSNLGFDLGVVYNSGARLSASLSASRSATASVNVGAQSQLVQSYAADIDYRLGRAITLGAGASYDQRDYRNSFSTDLEPTRRLQDKITRVFGTASYSPVALYSLGVEVSYQDRSSNPVEYSFDAFAALLRLSVNFGR
jgi:hypothetical protein